MAKNGNASAMKELLLNFLKYANLILNTVLGNQVSKPQAAGYVCGYGQSAMTQNTKVCS